MSRRSSNMIVKRIVTNFAATDVSKARHFYADILGLEVVMDHGWIVTFASPAQMAPQVSVATEGDASAGHLDQVDDLDEVERRVREAGLSVIEYGPTNEPWGVRRFYVEGPAGQAHQHPEAWVSQRLFLALNDVSRGCRRIPRVTGHTLVKIR